MDTVKPKKSYSTGKLIGLILGIVLFVLINNFLTLDGLTNQGKSVLATLALVACWWITEAINTGIAGLIPLVLFPLTGALSAGETAAAYGNNTIFMFFGGFAIALALERWNLHNRIALNIIKVVGTSLNRLAIGIMLSATFISMWVSNTATIIMLLPICNAISSKISELILEEDPTNTEDATKFKKKMVMSAGFGAIIGGSMTLIGTPTNISLASFAGSLLGMEIPFVKFTIWELPIAISQLLVSIFILNNVFYKTKVKYLSASKEYISNEIKKLGKITPEEKVVSVVFGITVFMWVTLTFIWKKHIPGISDSIVSVIAAVVLYIIPNTKGSRMLDADSVSKFPWAVILMLMGGMAIAAGFSKTDLAVWLGNRMLLFKDSPQIVLVTVTTGLALLITQVAPNTATGSILIPLVHSIATAVGINPFILMTSAALGAGFAATIPSGTPLMGIIYSQGDFEMIELIKVGIAFVIVSFVMVTLSVQFLLPVIF